MRNTKNAFTLVELIVVITILAILGTIAFISLQGYSADARNSKRTSDLGNIQSAINLKQVEGTDIMSFVNGNGSDLTTIALAGSGGVDSDYAAGTPNYTVLNIDAKDFKDPNDQEYRVGATKAVGGKFQVAATVEIDGTNTAIVNGTYVARTNSGSAAERGTVASTGSLVSGNTLVVLSTADANKFKAGDFVTDGTATAVKVLKVSKDGITITLTGNQVGDFEAGDYVSLNADETAGLIADKDTDNAIINQGTTYLPY